MKKVLVTGANGMLKQDLCPILEAKGYQVIKTDVSEMDITNSIEVDNVISAQNIGAYKNFIDQDFMKQIEEQLGDYCFYPEKENLSEESWNLLKIATINKNF